MLVRETWVFTVKDAYDRGAEESICTVPHRKKNYEEDRKNYTISSLGYLTSLSDIIPFIK